MLRAAFLLTDFIAYIAIIFVAITLRRMEVNYHLFLANIYAMLPFFPLFTLTLYLFSFYDTKDINNAKVNYSNLLKAVLANVIIGASVLYFFAAPLGMVTPKTILVAILVLYPAYIYTSRKAASAFVINQKNIIIFGDSSSLEEIKKYLAASKQYNIILAQSAPLESFNYDTDNVDFIVISSKLFAQHPQAWPVIAAKFIQKGVLLKTDLNFYEDLLQRTPQEGLTDAMWLLRGVGARESKEFYPIAKRVRDLLVSLALFAILFIPSLFIALLIRLVDGFNPFFTQERVGYMQKTIHIYKFRTMIPQTETVTKLGSILRRFRIDEFPQLINIIKGDISIVGPRPIWRKDYDILNKNIPSHGVRSIVKPGLTGWAQLNFKAPPNYAFVNQSDFAENSKIFDDAITRFSYDVWYIKNRSFILDLEIIIKTAKRMFIKDKNVAQNNR